MPQISIFPLAEKPEYIDTCTAWAYGEWVCQSNEIVTLEKFKDLMMPIVSNNELPIAYIAFYGEKIAGMATLKETEHKDRMDLKPWLGGVFVHPYFRGKGIGQVLCNRIESIAKDNYQYKKIHLQTASPEFYKPMGYEKIGMVSDHCEQLPEGQTLMQKHL